MYNVRGYMMLYLIYFVVSLLIGLIGRNKRFGFWGFFFGSILLTPIIGLLLLLAATPVKSTDKQE